MIKISPLSTISLITIAVLVVMLWGKSCKINKLQTDLEKCEQTDKPKPIHDTTIVLVPEQHPISESLSQTNSVKPTKPRIDSFIQFETVVDTTDLSKLKQAYFDLVNEFNTKNSYTDTAIFKNGIAITSSEVFQNRLRNQRTILDSIKANYTYITNTKYVDKDRTQMYLGVAAFGDKTNLINAAGVEALLKLKSNIGIESGAYFNDKGTFYKAGFKFLIRLKNKHL